MGHSTFVCTLHFSIVLLAILAVPILGPRARVLRGSVSDLSPVWRVSEAAWVDSHHKLRYYRSQNIYNYIVKIRCSSQKNNCQNVFQWISTALSELRRGLEICQPCLTTLPPCLAWPDTQPYLLNHRDKNYPPASAYPPILHFVYFPTKFRTVRLVLLLWHCNWVHLCVCLCSHPHVCWMLPG